MTCEQRIHEAASEQRRRCRECDATEDDWWGLTCGWSEKDLCGYCADTVIQPRTILDQAEEWRHRMAGMARVIARPRTGSDHAPLSLTGDAP